MAESATGHPPYGDFGQAHFDQNENEWHFERDFDRDAGLKALEGAQVIVPPVVEFPSFYPESDGTAGQSRRLEKQAKALVQTYPELQPAFNLLPELARVSEAVEEAVTRHDPGTGNLLAFGRIQDPLTNEFVEIAAFPCSPTGGDLRIVQLQNYDKVWDNLDATTLELPTISGQEATWNGPGAAIRSITFARPAQGQNEFLAVRLCVEIWIFRPFLKKEASRGSSRLHLDVAMRVGIDEKGGLPLAHVAFNHWASGQFAMVDEAGVWSVRTLVGGEAWIAEEIAHGDLMGDPDDVNRKPMDDGWARVMWVGDQRILVICNRRTLLLFHIGSQESEELPKVTTVLEDNISWNLDVAFVFTLPNYLFVLTTAHILIYNISWSDNAGLSWKCALCLRHFRNPADISLRLHSFLDGQDVLLFLRSDSNSTIMIYRFDFSNVDYVVASVPTELAIPMAANTRILKAPVSSLWLHSLDMARHEGLKSSKYPVASVNREATRYYSITTLHKDLAVLQTLCLNNSGAKLPHVISSSKTGLPSEQQGKATSGSARSRAATSSLLRDRLRGKQQADMFVPQKEQDRGTRNHEATRQHSVPRHLQQRSEPSRSRSGNEWTVGYELTLRQLNDMDGSETTDIIEVLNETYHALQTSDVGDVPPMRTLKELSGGELVVRNLQDANASLENLQHLQAVQRRQETPTDDTEPGVSPLGLVLRQIGWTPAPSSNGRDLLSSFHQSVVDNWILPLSDDIPDIIRTTRAQRALHMATEVTFASLVIRPEHVHRDELPHSEDPNVALNLPLRQYDVPSSLRTTPSVYYDTSSQPQSPVFPTPSRSTTPSSITSSGRASAVAAPEIARLSRYTAFQKAAPPSLPRSLRRVMLHWISGTDPGDYDWQATSRRFTRQDEEEEGEELTEKEQRRRQQRLERRARRRQRHEEESQRMHMRSSQAPEIMTESQPMQTTEGYGVNVVAGNSQTAASQILPGRHGGRQPARKKRKSGF